jgi:CheY-like chemotaxis protein
VDLVLSDYLMPSMNGAELAAHLKSQHPKLPVVLLSGMNEMPVGSELADAFVSKIEGPDSLCQRLAAFLSHSSASQS